jgi:hypothetical protein
MYYSGLFCLFFACVLCSFAQESPPVPLWAFKLIEENRQWVQQKMSGSQTSRLEAEMAGFDRYLDHLKKPSWATENFPNGLEFLHWRTLVYAEQASPILSKDLPLEKWHWILPIYDPKLKCAGPVEAFKGHYKILENLLMRVTQVPPSSKLSADAAATIDAVWGNLKAAMIYFKNEGFAISPPPDSFLRQALISRSLLKASNHPKAKGTILWIELAIEAMLKLKTQRYLPIREVALKELLARSASGDSKFRTAMGGNLGRSFQAAPFDHELGRALNDYLSFTHSLRTENELFHHQLKELAMIAPDTHSGQAAVLILSAANATNIGPVTTPCCGSGQPDPKVDKPK